MNRPGRLQADTLIFISFILLGGVLAYVDQRLHFQTILVETVHALVVTLILIFCLICQRRYPEIKAFGWNKIVWGCALLMLGGWIDILDDPPMLPYLHFGQFVFGRSWEQAFLKKILGYSAGIGLVAYGFFEWVPWMISTRMNVERLNQKLSSANQNMQRVLTSLDDHVESERLNIARELHDDVAQNLTYLTFQLQICQKEIEINPQQAQDHLIALRQDVADTLKSVRQISHDLRPEQLYALGFIPSVEEFIQKLRHQAPDSVLRFHHQPLTEKHPDGGFPFEKRFNDRELLHLFRIIQEGVRNTLKHSRAKHIDIHVAETVENLEIRIVDDGVGLPWSTMPSNESLVQEGHLGIVGIQERVNELSGIFSLENYAPRGTQMAIRIPRA